MISKLCIENWLLLIKNSNFFKSKQQTITAPPSKSLCRNRTYFPTKTTRMQSICFHILIIFKKKKKKNTPRKNIQLGKIRRKLFIPFSSATRPNFYLFINVLFLFLHKMIYFMCISRLGIEFWYPSIWVEVRLGWFSILFVWCSDLKTMIRENWGCYHVTSEIFLKKLS